MTKRKNDQAVRQWLEDYLGAKSPSDPPEPAALTLAEEYGITYDPRNYRGKLTT